VILGCANQAGEDNRNVARMSLLLAGLPYSVPGETVNRLCASGLSASISASRTIMVGDADLMIAGGVENMTRGPWVISKTSTPFGRDAQMFDSSFGWRFVNPKMKENFGTDSMGETAENLNDINKISREDQDKFNDGACVILLASEDAIKKYNLKPKARIVSSGVVGVEPRIMGIGPVEASNRALKKAGLKMSDMDIIELNEAFSVQSLVCTRSWRLADNDSRINPNGGAIALGHPLGMSGARILNSASIELHEQNKKYALVTMCIGVGQGFAVVIEKC